MKCMNTSFSGFIVLFIGMIAVCLCQTNAFGVVPPREGSGAIFPITREEMVQRKIGQPSSPLPRFLVPDGRGGTRMRIEGEYPVPVLIGDFPNLGSFYTREEFQTMLFDGPWPTGTMTDYYHEVSYDNLTLDGSIYGWYEVPETYGYYEGGSNGFGFYPNNAQGFVEDLVILADPDVDFSPYDNDGPDGIPNSGDDDGYVDQLFVVHAGQGGECGGAWLWSHSWSLPGYYTTNDSSANGGFIRVDEYILMPELSCGGGALIEIGVFCHEFGHSLNLPDLYDGDGSSEGIGGWGLMGSGSYGGDQRHPETPSHMCAWSKEQLGWLDPIEVPVNVEEIELPRVEDNQTVLKIWRDGDYSGPEYFLVENRQQVGFDASLLSPGLLIWHVDNRMGGNNNENHYLVDLEQADGRRDLNHGANRGDSGDPYPGYSGNRYFNWSTLPNSQDYNLDTTEVAVNVIGDPDSLVTIGLMTINYPVVDFMGYVIDDSGGDGDGVVDIGETVGITFTVHNYSDTPAESVWAQIVSSDPVLSFPVDNVFIGTIEGNSDADNSGQPFSMQVDPLSDIHWSEFTIELSGTGAFYYAHSEEFLIGHPPTLLVMDDEDDDYSTYYKNALDSLGVPYATRDVYQSGSPADSLEPFETLVWFTGRATENTITQEDQDSLRSFIGRGGRLFLSGQNIAEDLSSSGPQFLEEVLGVSYGQNTFDPLLNGVQTNQVGAGLKTIITTGGGGANNQTSRDVLVHVPGMGAQAAVVYDTTSFEIAGITRHVAETDARIVFFGFGFEAINRTNPNDTTMATRGEVMSNIIDFLMGEVGIGDGNGGDGNKLPRTFALFQNYPNPFNPMTTLSFSIPERRDVTLRVYDLRGRKVRELLHRTFMPGHYSVQWDGRDDQGARVASGIYLYRLESDREVITRRMLMVK